MPAVLGARHTGVSASTPFNLLVDAGAVYINYGEVSERLLGATRGGNVFRVNQTFRSVPVDGTIGAVNAMTRIINVEATMTVHLLELSAANLMLAFPGAVSVAAPIILPAIVSAHTLIRRSRNVIAADFMKNIALVGTIAGKLAPVICMLYNALQTDNIQMSTSDDSETVTDLIFKGHFDLAALDKEPWGVWYPSEVDPVA